jgi:type IV pilus assembly protein PilY1
MNKTPRTLAKLILSTVVPTVLMSSFNVQDANAAPGVLQNVPFAAVSTSVQPNILFLLDDSGSMGWESVIFDGRNEAYYIDVTPTFGDDFEMLRACSGFNTLYYNPNFTYSPWKGLDEDGVPYTNQDPTAARLNPYSTDTTVITNSGSNSANTNGVLNLVTITDGDHLAGYSPWNDTSTAGGAIAGDGVYQANECPLNGTGFVTVASLNTAQRTNFANWYSYYRSRSYVAKNSLLGVVKESRARIGIAGLLGNSGSDGIPIKDIDDITLSDGTTEGDTRLAAARLNKAALLDQVASSRSQGGTPLSTTLIEAGEYFREDGDVPGDFFGQSVVYSASDKTISSTSPILNADSGGTCQNNFTVLFTDGFQNMSSGLYDDVRDAVGNADSDGAGDFDGGLFADQYSGTLADVAMHYLERDLAPGLTNNANIDDIRRPGQVINHQHMTTYTIGFGVSGNRDRDIVSSDLTDPQSYWPQALNNHITSIDDLRHAAWNGRGKFLASSSPQQLITDINDVFIDINQRSQSTTAASSVSSGFIEENSLVFQTQFDSNDWTGNLFTYRFDDDGIVDIANPIFDVQSILNTRVLSDNGFSSGSNVTGFTNTRNIITKQIDLADITSSSTTATTLKTGAAVGFDFTNLSTSQKAIFTQTSTQDKFPAWTGTDVEFGTALVNFLKGDSTHEEGLYGETGIQRNFRGRNKRYLGAIVNSSPQFVGVPDERYPNTIEGSNLYSTFKTAQKDRTPIVYVGGNDGMLHAFDVSVNSTTSAGVTTISAISGVSGSEVFAYIPGILTADLPQIAQSAFDFDSFVDATPTIRDVYVDANGAAAGTDKDWRTYLVGGLRNGGRGIYALDVTDPHTTFDASAATNAKAAEIVRFEYTHEDLGFTYSRPQIAKMNDGSWVTVVGNGYNSLGDGAAKLFLIDLETGLPLTGAGPTVGGNASNGILNTGAGTNLGGSCLDIDATDGDPASDCNGLSSPTLVDLNGDFKVDRIYAGDAHGNMWVFNVQSTTKANWSVTKLFTASQSSCTAVGNGSNCRQPITTRPEVALHPKRRSTSTSPNILVLFGTGQFIAEGDASISANQSFYSVWDATGTSGTVTNNNLTKTNLSARNFGGNLDSLTVTGVEAPYNTSASPSNFGWYVDLSGNIAQSATDTTISDPFDRGRVSINPIISGSLIFFITTVPSGGQLCNAGEIPGFLTALDFVSGKTPDFAVFLDEDGNPLSSSTIGLNNGAVGLGLDTTKDGTQTRVTNIDGSITQDQINNVQDIPSGRKSWSILR